MGWLKAKREMQAVLGKRGRRQPYFGLKDVGLRQLALKLSFIALKKSWKLSLVVQIVVEVERKS